MNEKDMTGNGLPSWLAVSEEYTPPADRDAFITGSTKAVLGVLSKLRFSGGREGRYAASPFLKLLYTLLFILLTACTRNFLFTAVIGAGTLLALAIQPANALRRILAASGAAALFSALILLPAVFMGNPSTLMTIVPKVFISVTLIGLLSAGTPWNRLTAALRVFHIPNLFIFTLDITLKYISVLGELCMDILTALKLRSVGKNRQKARSFSGVLGITFIKSREMSEEMYAAMCCRGFTGEYSRSRKLTLRRADLFYLLLMGGVIIMFICLNR